MIWKPAVTGRLEGAIAVVTLAAATAAAILPADLDLAPQTTLPAGRHPLIILFGRQSAVRPGHWPFGASYLEVAVALPFVRPRDGGPGPFCHLPRLFLDRALPTVLGRWLYGFAKERADLRMAEDGYAVADRRDGARMLAARFEPAEGPVRNAAIRPLLEQPLINRDRRSRWRTSRFDFALDQAMLRPLAAEVTVERPFLPGLPPGRLAIAELADRSPGAFRIETAWTLDSPLARPLA